MCSREETKKIVHEEGGTLVRKLTLRFGGALVVTAFVFGGAWVKLNEQVSHNADQVIKNQIRLELVADKQNNILVTLARIEAILVEIQKQLEHE